MDGYPVRIKAPGQFGRVNPVLDVRYLGGGKCEDVEFRIVSVAAIENMEIASCGAHDQQIPAHRTLGKVSMTRVSSFGLPDCMVAHTYERNILF